MAKTDEPNKIIYSMIGVSKRYDQKVIFHDIYLSYFYGAKIGVLGLNGSGKSSLLKILAGVDKNFEGQISLSPGYTIGYLEQEPALDPNLTGGQILEYFANLHGGVDRAYQKKLIWVLELDTSRKFRQYSTGNKRKVVLIQAFQHRPQVLILDEPTSGLDPLNQQVFDSMVKEAREEGRTVFLSSHVLSEVEKTCTRVGIIREGRLVRIGGVQELKDIKRYEVTISFAEPVPADAFKAVDGVSEVEQLNNGHAVRIAIQGPADAVIKAAARYPVVSLTSYEPSLEDIFLKYYEADGKAPKEAAGVV